MSAIWRNGCGAHRRRRLVNGYPVTASNMPAVHPPPAPRQHAIQHPVPAGLPRQFPELHIAPLDPAPSVPADPRSPPRAKPKRLTPLACRRADDPGNVTAALGAVIPDYAYIRYLPAEPPAMRSPAHQNPGPSRAERRRCASRPGKDRLRTVAQGVPSPGRRAMPNRALEEGQVQPSCTALVSSIPVSKSEPARKGAGRGLRIGKKKGAVDRPVPPSKSYARGLRLCVPRRGSGPLLSAMRLRARLARIGASSSYASHSYDKDAYQGHSGATPYRSLLIAIGPPRMTGRRGPLLDVTRRTGALASARWHLRPMGRCCG